jgi:hypothetical protein
MRSGIPEIDPTPYSHSDEILLPPSELLLLLFGGPRFEFDVHVDAAASHEFFLLV